MSQRARPVVAVVPHYDMAVSLGRLLPQLLAEDYARVYVLDDASPDREAFEAEVAGVTDPRLHVVRSTTNQGPSLNRNRILRFDDLDDAILHFIDADTELTGTGVPAVARQIFDDESVGMVGGLIIDADGQQFLLNYGPEFTFALHVRLALHAMLVMVGKRRPPVRLARTACDFLLYAFPNPFAEPAPARDVFWVAEATMLIPYATLRCIGGFPPLKVHETQVLALELDRLGLRRRFDPRIRTRNHNLGRHG